MSVERYPNTAEYQVDEMTGAAPVANPAIKLMQNLSQSIQPPRFCWMIQETGPSGRSVILACERYKDKQEEKAKQRVEALNKKPKPGHTFSLIHLKPEQTYPYPLSSAWGDAVINIPVPHLTHCTNDGLTCG